MFFRVSCCVKSAKISGNNIMAESRKVDIIPREDYEGILMALPGKSKLRMVVLTNWHGKKTYLGQ